MLNIVKNGIIKESIVDGDGIRSVIFFQGCLHDCEGCHNPETHKFGCGVNMTVDEIMEQLGDPEDIDGVTLSGGDPLFQAKEAIELVKRLREKYSSIIIYTGFTWKQYKKKYNGYTFNLLSPKAKATKDMKELVMLADYVVDGRYVKELRRVGGVEPTGSSNQRVINVKDTLIAKEIIKKVYI